MGQQGPMPDRPWKFHLSGCLALDLANTISWRASQRPIERLTSADDYIRWARQSRVIGDREARELTQQTRRKPAEAAAAIARVRTLREAIYRALSALANRDDPDESDLATINTTLSETMRHLRVTRAADGGFVAGGEKGPPSPGRVGWPAAQTAGAGLASSGAGALER